MSHEHHLRGFKAFKVGLGGGQLGVHSHLYFSVWYLSFYCDPRIQLAVISKILMEGLLASARLYGEYMESYLWTEEEVEGGGGSKVNIVRGFY